MTVLAPTLQSFFTDYLIGQRAASGHTITAYRDTLRLFLGYVQERTGIRPSNLDIATLDAELVGDFLAMLEERRGNGTRTRNARLAAIHSLFKHAALRHPEHAELIARVLAIPPKRAHQGIVNYLNDAEADALLGAPDRSTWTGRRDHAMLLLMLTTGVRVCELTALRRADICSAEHGAYIAVTGKGRKERLTPLEATTTKALRVWLRESPGVEDAPLFPARGTARRMSSDAVAQRLVLHTTTAGATCRPIATKHVTPHVLRHTCAMRMLAAGVGGATIALWLGHESPESTRPYLHADLALKQRALDRTAPPRTRPGRYKTPDQLLAFLESL